MGDLSRPSLSRFAWLSIAAAIVTIALKGYAYFLTGSVGLLSDAIESFVNLAGAILALSMLRISARPADDNHAYGHTKAEYFAAGVEGALIAVAALSIAAAAIERLLHPKELQEVGLGLAVSVVAAAVNLGAALVLLRAGRTNRSITLEADAQHLLTDVWTTGGVLAGVALVAWTGWGPLDPIVAIAVAVNVVRTGYGLVRQSVSGLMDAALPEEDQRKLAEVLERRAAGEVRFHAIRTRQSGPRRFVSFHVLVPGDWTVNRGHQLLEGIEAEVRAALPGVTVFTHLESLDDPASWDDIALDRSGS